MKQQPYDNINPGPSGIYRVGPPEGASSGRGYYRKRDSDAWFQASYLDTIETAIKNTTNNLLYDPTHEQQLWYVADLEGNPLEPREARRVGDPQWNASPEPEQLDLFE